MTFNLSDCIIENEGIIYKIINKYRGYYEIEDLYQAAVMGMVKASKNYNEAYNTKFITYAYSYMLGEVISFVNNNRNIKLNKDVLVMYKKIIYGKNILTQRLMREPSNYELSIFLELEETLIDNILLLTRKFESLDKLVDSDNKELSLLDKLADNRYGCNIDYIMIKNEIEKLPEPEKSIMIERYFYDKTQAQVAQDLGLYQVEVSRKEQKTLSRLKKIVS